MSEARFDPQNGTLRLTPIAARALAAVTSEAAEIDDAALQELNRAGIVVDGVVHPRLVAVGRCLAEPSARLRVDHAQPSPWTIDAWLDDKIAVLLRPVRGRTASADVVAVPRGMVALNLARSVGLGPRQRVKVDQPVELDEGLMEALLGSGEGWSHAAIESMLAADDEVLPEWLEVLGRLSHEPKRRWRMGAWWNSAEESPAARLLEVVEADLGSFLVTHRRDPERRYRRVRLHPLTSSRLWRLLCGLVPSQEEVDRPLVD